MTNGIYKGHFKDSIYWDDQYRDDRTPYTYLMRFEGTQQFYYGVRYGEGCQPTYEDFYNYFGSSDIVDLLVEQFGKQAFSWEIRKTFENFEYPFNIFEAILWENRVLTTLKVVKKPWLWLNQHDTIHFADTSQAREKRIQTWRDNYGVDNPSQAQEIKDKKAETSLKNNGVECVLLDNEMKIERSQAIYGVDYPMQSEEVKERGRETCRETYGVDYPMQDEEIKQRCIDAITEKYDGFGFQSEELRDRAADTLEERTGVRNATHLPQTIAAREDYNNTLYKCAWCDARGKSVISNWGGIKIHQQKTEGHPEDEALIKFVGKKGSVDLQSIF